MQLNKSVFQNLFVVTCSRLWKDWRLWKPCNNTILVRQSLVWNIAARLFQAQDVSIPIHNYKPWGKAQCDPGCSQRCQLFWSLRLVHMSTNDLRHLVYYLPSHHLVECFKNLDLTPRSYYCPGVAVVTLFQQWSCWLIFRTKKKFHSRLTCEDTNQSKITLL